MKNAKKIISVILCILLILLMFSLTSFAGDTKSYYGDVNRNGKITSSDARVILRVSAMLETFTDEEFIIADINQDGKISSSDARKTLRIAVMLDPIEEIKEKELQETEIDILKNISTFIPFEEYEKTAEGGNVKAYKNLANNIIITDSRENKTLLKTEVKKNTEGEYAGTYSLFVTDNNTEKTFEIISDNTYVIVFSISDYSSAAVKFLSFTDVDDFVFNDDDNNIEILGFWIYFDGEIMFPEREPIFATEDNIKIVTTFKVGEGTDEAKQDYPNAKFLINDAQNIVIIDQRTNNEPLDISCTIGLDKWNEEAPVFKMLIKTENNGEEDIYDFEVGEQSFVVVNILDDGFSAFSSNLSSAEDYIKM